MNAAVCGPPAVPHLISTSWSKLESVRNRLRAYVQRFVWVSPSTVKGLLLLSFDVLLTLLFLACFNSELSIPLLLLRTTSGILALVVIPGAVVAECFFPKIEKDLALDIAMGFVLSLVEFQVLLSLQLIANVVTPSAEWVSAASILVVTCGTFSCMRKHRNPCLAVLPRGSSRHMYCLLLLGLAIRLVVASSSCCAISVDAALYSDYARNLVDGNFASSIANDSALQSLWDGVEYIRHQGTVFLFTLSWLILPPSLSGPTFLLQVAGSFICVPIYRMLRGWLCDSAATIAAGILVFHPLMVFHSVVGFGPEIFSLYLLTVAIWLTIEYASLGHSPLFVVGFMIGLLDTIWYPNFYLACMAIPVFVRFSKKDTGGFHTLLAVLFGVILLGRLFPDGALSLLAVSICSVVIVLLVKRQGLIDDYGAATMAAGSIVSMLAWRWPFFFTQSGPSTQIGHSTMYQIIEVVGGLRLLDALPKFVIFLGFHITVPLLIYAAYVSFANPDFRFVRGFFGMAMLYLGAILLVLSSIPHALEPEFLFSDSRFFLVALVFIVIAVAAGIDGLFRNSLARDSTLGAHYSWPRQSRVVILLLIVSIGFTPSYALMGHGISNLCFPTKLAWNDLDEAVSQIGSPDSRFVVDRARDFSWYTGRLSVVLTLSAEGLTEGQAGLELIRLSRQYNAQFFVMDGFTLAHWKTFESAYRIPLSVGSLLLLDYAAPSRTVGNSTSSISSLKLAATTEPNENGDYVRIFAIVNSSFSSYEDLASCWQVWTAGNDGAVESSSNGLRIVIGHNRTYSFLHYDMEAVGVDGIHVHPGFLLVRLGERTANVSRVSLWGQNGEFVRFACQVDNDTFVAPLGEEVLGDIRVVIEGCESQYVTISSISFWQATNKT